MKLIPFYFISIITRPSQITVCPSFRTLRNILSYSIQINCWTINNKGFSTEFLATVPSRDLTVKTFLWNFSILAIFPSVCVDQLLRQMRPTIIFKLSGPFQVHLTVIHQLVSNWSYEEINLHNIGQQWVLCSGNVITYIIKI